ncbi:probable serine/threonine-protein kinase kinX [Saccostrea echinata]|uniref:probable serine/threonine-protein kinase kinX n=1 Tax=Saccostrea echinata TaxID=191078 RepID=UPI002A82B1A3|nr:probable serine/threonine-protein kinase kinX [Saccostrea echinata]
MGCNKSKNQEPTTGELSQTNVPNEEVKALAEKFKADVEKEFGTELDTFEAVSFRKQVVAANLYFIKVKVGDEYAHIRIYDPIPKPSDKAVVTSSEEKTEPTDEKSAEEKGESSDEKGEGSEEKGEGSEETKDEGSEEKKEDSTKEDAGSSEETVAEEQKPTAKFEGIQKGKTLEDDIVEFEEPSPCEEVQEAVEEAPEPPKEEPKEEEPKEEPKEEEPKEEGGGILDTIKAGASSAEEEGSGILDTVKAGASSVGVSF